MPTYYFDSNQQGAPILNATVGSLLAVLDACLVTGFPAVDVVSITVEDNVATVQTDGTHGFATDDFAQISGAAEVEFNGVFQVRRVDAQTFTFPVYAASVTQASGSIKAKRPALGWDKVFTGVNKAVYRAKEGLRPFLWVNDSAATPAGTREAQWRGYRTMSDVDNGEEPFPTPAQLPNGMMVYKTASANELPQPWILIGDERAFYVMCQIDSGNNNTKVPTGASWPMWHAFGELARPFIEDDPYCCFIAGMANANAIGNSYQDNGVFYPSNRNSGGGSGSSAWLLRGISGVADLPVQYSNMGHCWDETVIGEAACFTYPHKTDNGMMITPIRAASENALRGYMPGFYESMHGNITGSVPFGTVIDGEFIGLEGRKFKVVTGRRYTAVGCALFDITGPWR